MKVAVLDYGIGNLRSAQKALEHLGADAHLVTVATDAAAADAVVLPGVGAFGACMTALRSSGLDEVARRAVGDGVPFLGICVGMQMMYAGSDESPGVDGLSLVGRRIRRLPGDVKRPQMQWNRLHPTTATAHPMFDGLDDDPWVYFVHSYAGEPGDEDIALCDYGGPTVAAIAGDTWWATQFHPEKSGDVGLAVLANFLRWAERAG